MPDQSTASTEHALIQEITEPLASLPDDPVPTVADVDFPIALRGYDRLAVDAYVKRTSQLVAELQATRSPESAVRRALGRVGEEVSGILQRAHETAEQLTAQSRIDAENRLELARAQAAEITAGAEHRLKELDSETERIWAERHRIVEDARDLARQLVALADSAVQRFPAADDLDDGTPAERTRGAQLFSEDGDQSRLGQSELDDGQADPYDGEAEPYDADTEPFDGEAEPYLYDDADGLGADDRASTAIMPPIDPQEPPAKPS